MLANGTSTVFWHDGERTRVPEGLRRALVQLDEVRNRLAEVVGEPLQLVLGHELAQLLHERDLGVEGRDGGARAGQRLARERAQGRERAVERLERRASDLQHVAQLRDRRLQVVLLHRERRDRAVQVRHEALERVLVAREGAEHTALAAQQPREVVVLGAEVRLGDQRAVAVGLLPVAHGLVEARRAGSGERGRELVEDGPEVLCAGRCEARPGAPGAAGPGSRPGSAEAWSRTRSPPRSGCPGGARRSSCPRGRSGCGS